MGKIIKSVFLGWLVLSIVTLPFYWPFIRMFWVFLPSIEAPDYEPPATAVEARLQDIDYLTTLTNYDRSFDEDEKRAFAEHLERAAAAADEMNDAEFYLALAEAVALAGNGHTNVSYRPQYTEFDTIGARLYTFSDGVFIVRAAPEHAEWLGHRVVAVDGVPIEDLQAAMAKYKGGNDTWRKLYSTLLIESPELLAASGEVISPAGFELTLEDPSSDATQVVSFPAMDADSMPDQPWRAAWHTLDPEVSNPLYDGWSHVLGADEAAVPNYLTTPNVPMSYALENNGLYIRALPGFEAGDTTIQKAYKAMLADHEDGSLDYLVIDFRLHDGGDYTKSMGFSKAAPKKVKDDGDIYIITGPNTFSAGIVTVAMLKHHAGDRGVIIGEQLGDYEQFWAERGGSFRLPNSEYYINYATGYHDWENGCKGEPFCYTMNEMFETPAGSLAPGVPVPMDFSSYSQGRDVVMEWVDVRH
ncbi:MAG: hypothetical protein AAF830_09440 [Pseudomonadota bacterium]